MFTINARKQLHYVRCAFKSVSWALVANRTSLILRIISSGVLHVQASRPPKKTIYYGAKSRRRRRAALAAKRFKFKKTRLFINVFKLHFLSEIIIRYKKKLSTRNLQVDRNIGKLRTICFFLILIHPKMSGKS